MIGFDPDDQEAAQRAVRRALRLLRRAHAFHPVTGEPMRPRAAASLRRQERRRGAELAADVDALVAEVRESGCEPADDNRAGWIVLRGYTRERWEAALEAAVADGRVVLVDDWLIVQ